MKSEAKFQEFYVEADTNDGFRVDYKRVLYKAVRFWYVIVLTVLVSLITAFLVNRYTTRIFPVTASLMVKEADISGAELLYNNPLINFKRNYSNEIYIIKSFPLIQKVVEDLGFDVTYYRQGNIIATEVYDQLPFECIPLRNQVKNHCQFDLKILGRNEYQLQFLNEDEEPVIETFVFGDTVQFGGFSGVFLLTNPAGVDALINSRVIVSYTPSDVVASKYVESLRAEWAEEGAGVINLSINGSNPRKEMDFLAGLIAQYQRRDLETKNEAASRAVDFISEQLEGIADSLRMVELRLESFKGKNVITDLSGEALRLYEKIEELETQKGHINVSKHYYKYLIEYIHQDKNFHQLILPSSVGISDPVLTRLISEMNSLQMEVKMFDKESNPLVNEGIRRINEMKKDIIESVRNQESTDNIKLQFLERQIREVESQLGRLPLAERNLVSIQRNYALQENLYIFLLQKRSEAAISKASNTSDIILVNPPRSGAAITPRTKFNYLVACILGLTLPFLAFVVYELVDNRIQSKDDVERLTSIPFIGGVGRKATEDNLAVINQPKSIIAESFRALRANLGYFIGQKDNVVILVTSSISGEGKTFTSVNLSSVLALSGKKTLIVGADMRRPKLSADFKLSNSKGLSTYLAGIAEFDEVIQSTSFGNLDLISGGPVPPNPSELLLTERMQAFFEEAKSRYNYIVIDTPPLAIVTDAFALVPYSDHIIFLVRQNYTEKGLLKAADDHYTSGKLRNVSLVLNDIHKSGPGYGYGLDYKYSYGYGYGYRWNSRSGKDSGYYE